MLVIMQVTKMGQVMMTEGEDSADNSEMMSEINDVIGNAHQMSCNLLPWVPGPVAPQVAVRYNARPLGLLLPPTLPPNDTVVLSALRRFRCPNSPSPANPQGQLVLADGCTCRDPVTGENRSPLVTPVSDQVVYASCINPGDGGAPNIAAGAPGGGGPCVERGFAQRTPNGRFWYGQATLSGARAASALFCGNEPGDATVTCQCGSPLTAACTDDLVLQSHVVNVSLTFYPNYNRSMNTAFNPGQLNQGANAPVSRIVRNTTVPLDVCMNCNGALFGAMPANAAVARTNSLGAVAIQAAP
jgi:hypothetical protein